MHIRLFLMQNHFFGGTVNSCSINSPLYEKVEIEVSLSQLLYDISLNHHLYDIFD